MRQVFFALIAGLIAVSLSGCQMVEALLTGPIGELPAEGTCATYEVVGATADSGVPDVIELTRTIIEKRLDSTGLADVVVIVDDDGLLRIRTPVLGSEEVDPEIRALVTTQGILTLMPVPPELDGTIVEGPLPEGMLDVEPLFTGVEIESAALGQDPTIGEVVVDIQLKETGAQLLDEHAAEHPFEQLAIVLDGEVLMAPVLQASRFDGRVQISGGPGFSPDEAQTLVTVLRYGSLPLEIREVDFGSCEPVASDAAAPNDLTDLLPRDLGGVPLEVRHLAGPDALAASAGAGSFEEMLSAVGKTDQDVRIAQAYTADLTTAPAYLINVFLVEGVEGIALFEAMSQPAAEEAGLPPDFPLPLETISGRTVWPTHRGPGNEWIVLYPSGALLVMAMGFGGMPLEEALPLLPVG